MSALHMSQHPEQMALATSDPEEPDCFFNLPPEIRNRIYGYVLTAPRAQLYLRMPYEDQAVPNLSSRLKRPILQNWYIDGPDVEFNQLKYVSCQAYAETAGLELKYNQLVVTDRTENDGAVGAQLLKFLEHVGVAKHSWLRGSSIALKKGWISNVGPGHGFLPDDAAAIARLASFCNANPSVGVYYTIPAFGPFEKTTEYLNGHLRPSDFIRAAIYYGRILREEGYNYDSLQLKREEWVGNTDIHILQAPNLRFRAGQNTLDETEFRDYLAHMRVSEEWLKGAKRFVELGVSVGALYLSEVGTKEIPRIQHPYWSKYE
jgi:hypothetical protein